MVIIDGWFVAVASVGDLRCILESGEGHSHELLDMSCKFVGKVERITASGGEVGRLNVIGGAEIGPLRFKLSNAGGRLVIASDGVWDALSFESSLKCCHGLSSESVANPIVKEAVHIRDLKDDTTCIGVDILPKEKAIPAPAPHPKKQGMGALENMFRRKPSVKSINVKQETSKSDVVEEIFGDGYAALAHRFLFLLILESAGAVVFVTS
ncbi:hypothetical protein LUZ63_000412 [Rhynchospora breviuscula]|uniref:protein-serine/threonine phosphatase n=1 Tax=Rhynchospora breviuscula TaxID=2022672 RepID=A0A9Q0HWU9_9POAL|nr:hypothetical protein LUZ63_000412 [Rhynchospora breviuscula]